MRVLLDQLRHLHAFKSQPCFHVCHYSDVAVNFIEARGLCKPILAYLHTQEPGVLYSTWLSGRADIQHTHGWTSALGSFWCPWFVACKLLADTSICPYTRSRGIMTHVSAGCAGRLGSLDTQVRHPSTYSDDCHEVLSKENDQLDGAS